MDIGRCLHIHITSSLIYDNRRVCALLAPTVVVGGGVAQSFPVLKHLHF